MTQNPPFLNPHLPKCFDSDHRFVFALSRKVDTMEEFGSSWCYQESIDELKQELIHTTLELETAKMEVNEDLKRNKEYMNYLLNLLSTVRQQRDEARDQLHKLKTNLTLSSNPAANSSVTDSNNLYTCSFVDSFFDAVSLPLFSNMNTSGSEKIDTDPASAIIDDLVKGKTLPQKGKLLQAVIEAGPLLQTLIVAGSLPRWRNPPPLQPLRISPVLTRAMRSRLSV